MYAATFNKILSLQHTNLLYFIISIIHNSDTTCKLPKDGVLTPHHVREILIQIYTTYLFICWYNNKHGATMLFQNVGNQTSSDIPKGIVPQTVHNTNYCFLSTDKNWHH